MRIPLTKYGLPQVVIYPAAVLVVMVVFLLETKHQLSLGSRLISAGLLAAILIWSLVFFRDPERHCPSDRNLLLAPADGKINDIETVRENDFISGTTLRIGIFLSIFDTHINRAPCNVKVEKITYRKGKYKNAMNPQSGRVNESNDLHLVRTDSPQDRLIVRQISGAIARRIVCDTAEGMELTGGQKFGMIKFGSRTELYVPLHDPSTSGSERYPPVAGAKCLVQIGDKVKAGLTPLVKYEMPGT
jgi:phosphatidylserine decarboxylase